MDGYVEKRAGLVIDGKCIEPLVRGNRRVQSILRCALNPVRHALTISHFGFPNLHTAQTGIGIPVQKAALVIAVRVPNVAGITLPLVLLAALAKRGWTALRATNS